MYRNTANYFTFKHKGENYNLTPNYREHIGAFFLFRSLGFSIGFAPKFLNENKDNSGSYLYDIKVRVTLDQFMQSFDVYFQKGFGAKIGAQEIYYKDIKTFKIGGHSLYVFNKHFSYRAAANQNRWQRKSAGSFIPKLSYYYTAYDFDQIGITSSAYTFDTTISPSYHYNFVFATNFLISAGVSAGLGVNRSNFFNNNTTTNLAYEYSGRVSFNYNSNTFFCGTNLNFIHFENKINNVIKRNDNVPNLQLYIGYRFKAPKEWVEAAEEFNKKYGF